MMASQTVYAVVDGAYSDYRIWAIYERAADAEAEASRMNRRDTRETRYVDDARVEEFDYFPAQGKPLGMGVK